MRQRVLQQAAETCGVEVQQNELDAGVGELVERGGGLVAGA